MGCRATISPAPTQVESLTGVPYQKKKKMKIPKDYTLWGYTRHGKVPGELGLGPSFPTQHTVYNTPFYSQKRLSLDSKLHGHPNITISNLWLSYLRNVKPWTWFNVNVVDCLQRWLPTIPLSLYKENCDKWKKEWKRASRNKKYLTGKI